ncbi:MAG: class I tRNA ligase family protein, partial [Planctomycetales bacterium]|nr:class I tRNA ligase family protein [Planctomycetales bacterium]
QRMDQYDNYNACQEIITFVDALSNWYVRRSRDRFWGADPRAVDKLDAYWTLYECLLTTAKVIAPFVPFLAEVFWRNLAGVFGDRAVESVHLCDFPTGDSAQVDAALSERMNLVREIASLGRAARMAEKLKVRQPLAKVEVILANDTHRSWLADHAGLIAEELNVKQVEFTQEADQYITYQVLPDFKRLGPRLGKQLPAVKKSLGDADGGKLLAALEASGTVDIQLVDGASVSLDKDDIQVRLQAKEGWAAAQGKGCVVVLATELTDDLVREGLVRDVVRAIQDQRKETGCEFTDRIELGIVAQSADLTAAVKQFSEYIASETLAVSVAANPIEKVEPKTAKVGGAEVQIFIQVVSA